MIALTVRCSWIFMAESDRSPQGNEISAGRTDQLFTIRKFALLQSFQLLLRVQLDCS